ncbi:MAG: response regulator [Clostridiaceae bacterium]
MYKILIVDDEKLIRKGIIAKLAHNNLEFSWTGEAANGGEALTIIESEKPDIVLTDIRMPVMDGIQLIRCCRENLPQIKFIIMSGYAEFSYAEQALNMGVSAYILKPVDDKNLVQTIQKVMKEISYSKKAENNAKEVAVLGRDRDELLRERILNQLFHTSRNFEKEMLLEQIGLKEANNNNSYILAILHVDSSSYYHSPFKFDDLVLIKFSIKNILEEVPCNCCRMIADNQKDVNQIFILFYYGDKLKLRTSCDTYIRNVYSKLQTYLHLSITIGISGIEDKLTSEIYKQSRLAFEQRLALGGNQIFYYERVSGCPALPIPEHKIKLLQRCMEISDLNGIQSILNDIFLSKEASDMAGIYIRLVYSEVISSLLKVCSSYGVNKPTDSDFLSGEVIEYLEDSGQIAAYLYTMISDIIAGGKTERTDCKEIVEEVKAFILNNYTNEITVGELANKYAINPDYLSSVFKQETGKNIIRYLTELRIEKACQLLKDSQAKISDISYSTGYNDRQYFNRVFKKITGMTPAEFRSAKTGLPQI